ncbi:C40 family peptidase [Nonomuraea africana]|uniref:Cell wall-associated NlpC family hydrolase n=1 Tax=Nonomuraea africana TaxID=46171 RepID=A0ABR9KBV0_9ACTN|nr:C40 family peptidase [Nonomuraea africana]MBE1559032.1 cell wall-associated NlpC family hydrolase [Nonomuraea africana]
MKLGRTSAAVVLALAALISVHGGALAEPPPTIPQARAKLVKLNERADQMVEKYNQATEAYRKAKKKYDDLNTDLKLKGARVETLRESLVAVAVNSYQYGDLSSWEGLIVQGEPQAMLGSLASIEQMAQATTAELAAFEAATKELRVQRNAAKAVLSEADAARDQVRGEKSKVDKLVSEQTKLLRRLGAFKVGNPQSTGIAYTGPASGNARLALQFAYAQIGKPYQYGGTGPGSYDCSGFTQASWRTAGVELPRTTWDQWSWGADRRVSLDALQPGDLLFSKGLGHMGMYAGNGKMVHSPQTGDVVKVVDLDDYWRGRLLGAVRP